MEADVIRSKIARRVAQLRWEDHKTSVADMLVYLRTLGVSFEECMRLAKKVGENAKERAIIG